MMSLKVVFLLAAFGLVIADEAWWGGFFESETSSEEIRPFQIIFDDNMIKDLRYRLENRRPITKTLEGLNFEFGMNSEVLEDLLDYWQNEYDFAARQKYLNQYPQFKTNIQGLDIHFIHIVPKVASDVEVIPVLMLHGWPGSIREFYDTIPILTQVRNGVALELVIPSLPGFGFSDATQRTGFGAAEIALVMKNLMKRLGHEQYYLQGGDWGAAIGSLMVTLYPDNVLGYHTNFPLALNPSSGLKLAASTFLPSFLVDKTLKSRTTSMGDFIKSTLGDTGFIHLQATKPDSLGFGLNDSPTALAAYILEKFIIWTEKNPTGVPSWLSKDGLFDNLMMYWASSSVVTSMRIYRETLNSEYLAANRPAFSGKTPVKTWAIQSKNEIIYFSDGMIKTKYTNLVKNNPIDQGGHFLAFELPEVFSEDVWNALLTFKSSK